MKTNGNDPANPIKDVGFDAEKGNISFGVNSYDFKVNLAGLTKREYFAAMAMQGLISNCYYGHPMTNEVHAKEAVLLADKLIEALNK